MPKKKILVIPDVHGRTFWKEPVSMFFEQVDRVVFLGDYLDPYRQEGVFDDDEVYENMLEIFELKKRNGSKVVLLKGNHDQHYASARFRDLAAGSRMDGRNWEKYHKAFSKHRDLFQLVHLEMVKDIPYVFSHAGLTLYWLHKVNANMWHLPDNKVFVSDEEIIGRLNMLDDDGPGQEMLAVVGSRRSWMGEMTGSVLWADVEEHSMSVAPKSYGMNRVFQVFGHTRLNPQYDMLSSEYMAMIDSRQAFMIDEAGDEKIAPLKNYRLS